MPAITPNSPAPPQEVIHISRKANHETTHAAREGLLASSLDDQMHVIVLNREVNDAKFSGIATVRTRKREVQRRQ